MIYLYGIFFIFLATASYTCLKGAPWVPTFRSDVGRFLKLAEIKEGDKVYDLGCGDGRLVCAAAKAGAEAKGFEIFLLPYFLALGRKFFSSAGKNIKIIFGDFWRADLREADIVYFFLMPKFYPKLKLKLENELKKGAKVIAYVWPIDGWEPFRIDVVEKKPKLYLYKR